MADQEFKRDVGSGDPLAAGEATEVNDELAFGRVAEDQIEQQSLLEGFEGGAAEQLPEVEYADDEPDYEPADEMEEILFADPEGNRPMAKKANQPVPKSVIRRLPLMSLAVRDPSTPPAVKAAYHLVLQRLEDEARRKGR